MARLTGARPSPRYRLAGATPHQLIGTTPESLLYKPAQLSMWLNDQYGDCVTAEECFAKACWEPEIFISDTEAYDFAKAHNDLNGSTLVDILDVMQSAGFEQNGKRYLDGRHTAVDWTNTPLLHNAIAQGPVKLGVAAGQLQNAAPESDPLPNGWFATGFTTDSEMDHCVSLCGFGTLAWLARELGVSVPAGLEPAAPGYGLFTWGSIAIIDQPSMLAITGEAWLRNPTTVVK